MDEDEFINNEFDYVRQDTGGRESSMGRPGSGGSRASGRVAPADFAAVGGFAAGLALGGGPQLSQRLQLLASDIHPEDLQDILDEEGEEDVEFERQHTRTSRMSGRSRATAGGVTRASTADSLQEDEIRQIDEEVVQEIFSRVRAAKEQVENYWNVFVFLMFAAVYFTMLCVQANSSVGYDVGLAHMPLLPPGFSLDQANTFASPNDFYQWLNDSVVQVFWKDPDCGNGVCETPLEYPAFGSLGCLADCGEFENLTSVIVTIDTAFDSAEAMEASSWNLCMSFPVSLCWFEAYQPFTKLHAHVSQSFYIPDGDWELWLNAPYGSVRGMVQTPIRSNLRVATLGMTQMRTLVAWGECMPEEASQVFRCRAVCAVLVQCLEGLSCSEKLSMHQLSGAFVDCVQECDYAPLRMLSYENKTCAQMGNQLPRLFQNLNCSSQLTRRGLSAAFLSAENMQDNSNTGARDKSGSVHRRKSRSLRSTSGGKLKHDELDSKAQYLGRVHAFQPGEDLETHMQTDPWRDLRADMAAAAAAATRAEVVAAYAAVADSMSGTGPANGTLWHALGPTDAQRLFNLKVAVSRLVYTMVKHKCLAEHAKPLEVESRRRVTAFLCTLFGGPILREPACNFTDPASGRQLTSAPDLFRAMRQIHAPLNVSHQHAFEFVELVLAAVRSTVEGMEDAADAMRIALRAFDPAVASEGAQGCNLDGPVLTWQQGQQLVTTIRAGEKVTWVWGDELPYSIKLAGFGEPEQQWEFQGFGGNRLVVSRQTLCTPALVGQSDPDHTPAPCVLRSAHDPPDTFTYTMVFRTPRTYHYSGGRYSPSLLSGTLTVLPASTDPHQLSSQSDPSAVQRFAGLQRECAPGCPFAHMSDGQCNTACFNHNCSFDGGDCACVTPGYDFPQCMCTSGQVRDEHGACCESSALGTDLSFPFSLRTFGPNVTESNGAFASGITAPLKRIVASRNRLLVGMFMYQQRSKAANCSNSRFSFLLSSCQGQLSTDPFGVNPHWLPSSSLYDEWAVRNLDKLDNATFGFPLMRNPQGLPYGFIFPMGGLQGYPLIFDINLDNLAATKRLQYLVDGFYIDNATRSVLVLLLTYNPDTGLLVLIKVDTVVGVGGAMVSRFCVHTLHAQFYNWGSSYDVWEMVLELTWIAAVLWNLLGEIVEMMRVRYETGLIIEYFRSFWNWIDLISISIQLTCIGLGVYLWTLTTSLEIQPRYDIYFTLLQFPRFWVTKSPPDGLSNALNLFGQVDYMVKIRSLYFSLQGINVFLVTLRLLKLFDFQPYLGFITRAIKVAAPQLAHFFFLWFIVYLSFSLFGYLVFGSTVEQFRTLGQSMLTCFLIILNDNSVYFYLAQRDGWEYVAGIVFFVAYTVVMVFVLLNFLVAIIVDAFMDVTDGASNSTTIAQDLIRIAKSAGASAGTGYFGRHNKLLHHLHLLGAQEVAYKDGGSIGRTYSLRRALSRLNCFRYFSRSGSAVKRSQKKTVIKYGERNIDSMTVSTILQRSYERAVNSTPKLRSRSQLSSIATTCAPAACIRPADSATNVDVRKLSDTVMSVVGEDMKTSDLPTVRQPTSSNAKSRQALLHIAERLESFQELTEGSLSDMRHLMSEMQQQLADIRAVLRPAHALEPTTLQVDTALETAGPVTSTEPATVAAPATAAKSAMEASSPLRSVHREAEQKGHWGDVMQNHVEDAPTDV